MYSQKSLLGKDMIAWNEYGPDPCGTTGMSYAAAMLWVSVLAIVGERKWESVGDETHLATLINSVIPPSHITSGCRISTARFSINFLNPYFEYSCSPVVNLM